ncbi:hypothetical protein RP29_11005 [Acidovorax temperans]|uniref:Uncharacterized protein n=1 Tax=Acidovorax temperans TaxID=80878 RepID=A0A0D7KBH7_9BURK|nr:hypothetical protein RP29_11005 [Acidovorax temperans]
MEFCRPYPNILAKAAIEFPQLPNLIALHLPPEMIADGVCAVLDGFVMNMDELPLPSDFMDD